MFDDTEDPCGLPEEYRQIRPSRTPRQLVRRFRQNRAMAAGVPTNVYMYGYNPWKWLTLAELEKRPTWAGLDPEFKRRILALFDASGQAVGIGGGWRSAAQQEALFRSRYTPHASPPGTFWNGSYWRLKPGNSPSTPPGRSYHEDSTPSGAIAGDLIGDLALAHNLGPARGLRDLGKLSPSFDEPWHFQPLDCPTARINYDGAPLATWLLPGTPPPDPPPDPVPPTFIAPLLAAATGDDMLRFVKDSSQPTSPVRWVSNGMTRSVPTFALTTWLIQKGLVSNTLDTADPLAPTELAKLPLINQ